MSLAAKTTRQLWPRRPERLEALSAGHPDSAQVAIDGPDHFFVDHEGELISVISQWLGQVR